MSEAEGITVQTNGKVKVPWGVLVGILWSLLLGLGTWTAKRELDRSDERIARLEQSDRSKENSIAVLQQLRPEDKALIVSVAESNRRLELNVARIMAKLDIEEAH
jgi:hypothetical protein